MNPWIILGGVAAVLGIVLLLLAPPPRSAPPQHWQEAKIGSVIDKAMNRLELISDEKGKIYTAEGDARALLPTLTSGDPVWFVVGKTKNGETEITQLTVKRVEIAFQQSIGAELLAFALIWGVILVVTQGHPWAFALGLDFRLSNSQTQLYLWFLIFSTVYLAELGLRLGFTGYLGGIGAPARLLALAGISALTFGAARGNTTLKAAAGGKRPQIGLRSRWAHFEDLMTNDAGRFDLGDFQMIALTGAAILIYLVTSLIFLKSLAFARHVNLPGVEDALLGGTSASQGAYLLKKIGSPAGN
jgi:hypothetical protein